MSIRVIYNVDRTMLSIYDTVSVWGRILPDDDRASAQADVELATVSEVLDPDPRKEHRRPFSSRIHKYRIRRMAAQESALAGSGLSAGRAIPAEDNVEVGKVFGTKMPGAGRPMDKEPLTTALLGHGVSPGSECRFRGARRRVSSPLDADFMATTAIAPSSAARPRGRIPGRPRARPSAAARGPSRRRPRSRCRRRSRRRSRGRPRAGN